MTLRCILAIDADGMGVEQLRVVTRAGYRPVAIWTGSPGFPVRRPAILADPFREPRVRKLARAVAEAGIPVRRLKKPWIESLLQALGEAPDFDVLVAAGTHIIFPGPFLERLPVPAVNFHPALLPHYRGPFPFHSMLTDGTADRFGGMTLHVITPQIDGGPIIGQRAVRLSDHPHPVAWMNAVMATMEPLMREDLRAFLDGRIEPRPQDPGSGSAHTLKSFPLHVAPGQSIDRISRFMAASPGFQRNAHVMLGKPSRKRRHVVTGQPEVLGPPTGAPPRVRLRHVEFDAADGRVRLRHISRFERWLRRVRTVAGLGRR